MWLAAETSLTNSMNTRRLFRVIFILFIACVCVCVCQTFQWSPVKIIIIIIILGAARLFLLAAMWAGLLWHDMKPTCQEGKTYICHMSYSKILHSLFPPLHQFCYPFPRHTYRFLSLHTSPPFPAVTLNFSSRSRLTPHQNSARRLKMYPSGIHRIPLSFPKPRLEPETCAWASVIGRIGVLTPPPPVCIPPPLTVCETWATTPFHQTWLH